MQKMVRGITSHAGGLFGLTHESHGLILANNARAYAHAHSPAARWSEVVDTRVADAPPLGVVLDARDSDIARRRHVAGIEPHRDVWEGGPLDFMERARIAQAEWIVRDALVRCPRVDIDTVPLVGPHHAFMVEAKDGRSHPIHVAVALVEVLGEDHTQADEDGNLQRDRADLG